MNWVKKLVTFFLGDDEKEFNRTVDDLKNDEQLNVKNVFNERNMTAGQSNDHQKAEARVSYQYPKGNFKFPVIPDETYTKKERDERPKRTVRNQSQTQQTAQKQQATPTFDYSESSFEEKKSVVEKMKKPFHPTSTPSPIYGFQTDHIRYPNSSRIVTEKANEEKVHLFNRQDEAVMEDRHVEAEFEISSSSKNKELQESSHQSETEIVDTEHTESNIRDNNYTLEERSIELFDDENNDTSINSETNEDVEEEVLQLLLKPDVQPIGDQLINENLLSESQLPSFDTEDDVVKHQEIESSHTNSVSFEEYKLAESNKEKEANDIQDQSNEVKVEHKQAIPQQKESRKSSHPFNVMMLGRDKQRIHGKEKNEDSYQFPLLSYLNVPTQELTEDNTWLESQKELLDLTLTNFNVRASVVNVTQGPAVTRFEVHPEPGVKVSKVTNLSDDIKLSLSAKDIRIEAPIPGKNTIGIEVPNKVSKMVYLREILRSQEFRNNPSPMNAVLGLDISGQPAVTDLKKMPHGLIAGATGSGKSVCINTILISLLYKAAPHDVKLMLIDPKMVELAPYNDIPHLVSPVITDVKAATAALKWAVEEMERRYELFAHSGTREITRYNQLVKEHKQGEHLPYLVIIIDELADLMMVAPNDVEESICRIAQKARACGIHLIVATQRPSVDVITGLIKANIPTRIAFSVSSQVDSRTIIDVSGAEKLLGKGDMLFLENGSSKAVRLQGTFVSDEEIERVVKHVKLQAKPDYLFHQDELVKKATIQSEEDELFVEACEFVVNQGGASTSSLQRRFRVGYNRAARLIDMMEEQGIVSENRGSKPRDILISEEDLDAIQESSTF
ncbi:S-DNA-T family DNA segregation ATPase FtsK/SpoIIIE [Metabacillus crassostreae]|uniref:DNA translocase FtsK n=1 Tax=Metabacillus crassostreae TaxID=929098 RepID=UPI00195823AE|nr:DNA translocase FtsK [Metabacillus crassostreae]MBM7606146.1 S-DNA-T family DNA segregation ATPase FtsK/SpoIIIE [Metabacillus crassostreae]